MKAATEIKQNDHRSLIVSLSGLFPQIYTDIYIKGCKEHVDTNVTVTQNIHMCCVSLPCSNRHPGGLWEQQQWNSNRFLKFHFFKLDNNSALRIQWWGIQRSVWSSLRGNIWHGQQRVHVELYTVDISGSEGNRRQGVLYDIPKRDELDLGERHYNRRKRPRPWDGQRNDHHGHAGHRTTDWRIRDCLGGRGDPLPERCTDHIKAGRSDPGELQSGIGDDRQRNDSE